MKASINQLRLIVKSLASLDARGELSGSLFRNSGQNGSDVENVVGREVGCEGSGPPEPEGWFVVGVDV